MKQIEHQRERRDGRSLPTASQSSIPPPAPGSGRGSRPRARRGRRPASSLPRVTSPLRPPRPPRRSPRRCWWSRPGCAPPSCDGPNTNTRPTPGSVPRNTAPTGSMSWIRPWWPMTPRRGAIGAPTRSPPLRDINVYESRGAGRSRPARAGSGASRRPTRNGSRAAPEEPFPLAAHRRRAPAFLGPGRSWLSARRSGGGCRGPFPSARPPMSNAAAITARAPPHLSHPLERRNGCWAFPVIRPASARPSALPTCCWGKGGRNPGWASGHGRPPLREGQAFPAPGIEDWRSGNSLSARRGPRLYRENGFHRGLRELARRDPVLGAFVFLHQLDDVTAVAGRHPDLRAILGHMRKQLSCLSHGRDLCRAVERLHPRGRRREPRRSHSPDRRQRTAASTG